MSVLNRGEQRVVGGDERPRNIDYFKDVPEAFLVESTEQVVEGHQESSF
jgi:hypothetical protein